MSATIVDPVRLRGVVSRLVSAPHEALAPAERAEAVSVLTTSLIGTVGRNQYLEALDDVVRLRGGELPAVDTTSLPQEAFLSDGPGVLSDSQLVGVATSPAEIRRLTDLVTVALASGRLGDVWVQSIGSIHRPTPDDDRRKAATARNRDMLRKLIAGELPSTDSPSEPKKPARTRRMTTTAAVAALVASLLVGVGLGWFLRGPDERSYASVGRLRPDPARGVGPDTPPMFVVENSGRQRLFVTVVGLSPTAQPRIFPRADKPYLVVEPRGWLEVKNFDAELPGATAYLAIVTDTPAIDLLPRYLPAAADPASAAELAARLADTLRGLGFRSPRVDVLTPP